MAKMEMTKIGAPVLTHSMREPAPGLHRRRSLVVVVTKLLDLVESEGRWPNPECT